MVADAKDRPWSSYTATMASASMPRPYEKEHAPNRNAAVAAAYASGGYTMRQLAAYFGLHYTSLSRIVKEQGVTDHA